MKERNVKILGGTPIMETGTPQILDQNTKQEPVTPEIRVHEEQVVEADKVRSKPPEPGEPQVRIRVSTGTFPRTQDG